MALYICIFFLFTGLTGIQSITTISKVSVKASESISIPCLYDPQYTNHVKYLCKGSRYRNCRYMVKTNQPSSSGKFTISDDKKQRVFTVTINELGDEDTYYWCAVEMPGIALDLKAYFELSVTRDMPSLSVDHQEVTGLNGENITINCSSDISGEIKWCKLGSKCVTGPSGSIEGTTVIINTKASSVFTVSMNQVTINSSGWYLCVKGDLQMPVHITVLERFATDPTPTITLGGQRGASADLKTLLIPLSLLILFVTMTLVIWFMVRKLKPSTTGSSGTAPMPPGKSDEDVTYSSVVAMKQPRAQRAEPEAEDVTYSILAQHP